MEKAKEATKGIAKDIGDVLVYALYPQTGMRFLKWKYGLEKPPAEVMPKTLEDVKREETLIKKALCGELVEKPPQKAAPEKGPGIRQYNVFVEGDYYTVEVEEVGGAPVVRQVVAAPQPRPVVVAAPAPAPAPAAEKKKVPEEVVKGKGAMVAPMPGMIVEVRHKVGEKVHEGEAIVILEAMKMQNPLTAPMDGVVKTVNVNAGDSVKMGDLLVVIE
jgi:biotin carboxyl carrier protein